MNRDYLDRKMDQALENFEDEIKEYAGKYALCQTNLKVAEATDNKEEIKKWTTNIEHLENQVLNDKEFLRAKAKRVGYNFAKGLITAIFAAIKEAVL